MFYKWTHETSIVTKTRFESAHNRKQKKVTMGHPGLIVYECYLVTKYMPTVLTQAMELDGRMQILGNP